MTTAFHNPYLYLSCPSGLECSEPLSCLHLPDYESTFPGCYSLLGSASELELDTLFVEPQAIGQGVGTQLFRHAVSSATAQGFHTLLIESDPVAAPFYRAIGAVLVGDRLSLLCLN